MDPWLDWQAGFASPSYGWPFVLIRFSVPIGIGASSTNVPAFIQRFAVGVTTSF